MTSIALSTIIAAPVELCFDLARDIDIHMQSTGHTNEKAIAGRTSGLCEFGDTVTWEATHFGIRQQLRAKITGFNQPYFFEDSMQQGAFKSMRHEHHFISHNGLTTMTDYLEYTVPYGLIGKIFDWLALKSHMTQFLLKRNHFIKNLAETKHSAQRSV